MRTVLHDGQPVGRLTIAGGLTAFELSEDYFSLAHRPVLGQQYEEDLRARWRQSARVPVWFSNLLPEDGPLLDFLAASLGISKRSEADLLLALGSDLPGAVHLAEPDGPAPRVADRHELADETNGSSAVPAVRFSVAGVQLKLSMLDRGQGLRLAGSGLLGDHYVKFPGSFDHVVENEYSMLEIARGVGLDVPEVAIIPVEQLADLPKEFRRARGARCFSIRRFDRIGQRRMHIEDFNQVLGQWPERKYDGCTYEKLGTLIMRLCGEDDFWAYVDRVLLNVAIGNEDAHLKNWSLIYRDARTPRLAPVYDVVSTIGYEGLDRGMALRLGASKDPLRVNTETIERMVDRLALDRTAVAPRLQEFVRRFVAAVPHVRALGLLPSSYWQRLADYQRALPLFRPYGDIAQATSV